MNISPWAARTRHIRNAASMLLACMLLASCASFLGPREVDIPLHKLQAGLERRFPLDNRMLELFDVHLSSPRLALHPEQDRVSLRVDAGINPPFSGRSYGGVVEFSGRLYVDQRQGAVMMAEPKVDRFTLDGMNPSVQRQLAKVATFVMDTVAADIPIYSFRMEDLRYGSVQFVPTTIQTTRSGLRVRLEPLK